MKDVLPVRLTLQDVTIVGTHAETGALVTKEGALPTAALASVLGLQVPADQALVR